MASSGDISARVSIDGAKEAVSDLQAVGKEGQKLDGSTFTAKADVDSKPAAKGIDDLLRKIDKVDGNTAKVLIASNAGAIGVEINNLIADIDKLDADDPQVEIKAAHIAELNGDLDRLEGKLREVDAQDVTVDVDAPGLDDVLDKLGDLPGPLGDIAGAFAGGGGMVAGVGAVAAGALAAATSFADAALAAETLSSLTGDSVENASRLQSVWSTTGADVNDLADVLLQMNGVLQTSPELAAQIGINLNDGKTVGERFVQVIEAIEASTLNAAEKAQLMSSVFGEEGVRQVAKLTTAVSGDLQGALDDVGDSVIIDDAEVEKAKKLNDQIIALNQQWKELWATVGEAAVGPVGSALDKLTFVISGGDAGTAGGFKLTKQELEDLGLATEETSSQLDAYVESSTHMVQSSIDAALAEKQRAEAHEATADAQERGKALMDAVVEKMKGIGKEAQEAAKAEEELGRAVVDANIALLDGVDASGAFADALKGLNATTDLDFSLMAENTVESFDTMKTSLEGLRKAGVDWSTVDLTPDSVEELRGMPDELGAVTQAISGMRGTIQTELQAAFDTGGIEAYSEKADFFANEILAQFPAKFMEMGASEAEAQAQTQELLAALGLLPASKQIVIELTREEEARNALEAFSGVIDKMPEEVQVAIATKIAEGDIQGALALLNDQLVAAHKEPIVLPIDAEISAAVTKADEAQAHADSLVGTETYTGEWQQAQDAADAAKAHADSLVGTETVDADAEAARQAADDAKEHADGLTGEINVDADTTAAANKLAELTKPRTVHITANMVVGDNFETGGTVPPGGGIAGESGPEFIRLPGGKTVLLSDTTIVPQGTRVTSAARTRALLKGGVLPRFAAGTGGSDPLAAVWPLMAKSLERLAEASEAGNDTADDIKTMLNALDPAELGEDSAQLIATLLSALSKEQIAGNADAVATLKTGLAKAIEENAFDGLVRFEDDSFGPANPAWVRFEDGSFGPVIDALNAPDSPAVADAAKEREPAAPKEDPNTAILQKISGTLLDMASWDKTASSMLMSQLMLVFRELKTGVDMDSAVRGAAMTIRAGAA